MVVQFVAGFLKITDLQRFTITVCVSCAGYTGFVSMYRSQLFFLHFATVSLSWSRSVCVVITLPTKSPRRCDLFPRCKKNIYSFSSVFGPPREPTQPPLHRVRWGFIQGRAGSWFPTSTSITKITNEWKYVFILFHSPIACKLTIKFHCFFSLKFSV